ncbi:4335_t:CDS:2 [Acaulospora colombiana]|uniref:4335_t:CDS:1 n=1 Tax=Acaulospora colombiana TaxID=27376 RepID=A0ACA9N4E0_9GLOM|nr:4335_t:CDS:2 [Acaulospora colombiana]
MPLLLLVISLWIHSTTQPGMAIILDFIGKAPVNVTGVMFFDFAIATLELVGTAMYYEHAIIFSRYHRMYRTFEATISTIINLVQDNKHATKDKTSVLYKDPRNISGSVTNATSGQGEGEEDTMLGQNPTTAIASRLPLPFNLDFTRPNRTSRTGNAVPGALLRDW